MSQSFQLKEQFIVSRPIAQVFDYLADFSQIADWDPSVLSAKKYLQVLFNKALNLICC